MAIITKCHDRHVTTRGQILVQWSGASTVDQSYLQGLFPGGKTHIFETKHISWGSEQVMLTVVGSGAKLGHSSRYFGEYSQGEK